MKILLTGAAGQLGQALRQQVPAGVELNATSRSGDPPTGLGPPVPADASRRLGSHRRRLPPG